MIPKDSSGLMTEVQKLAAVEAYAEALRAFGGGQQSELRASAPSCPEHAEGLREVVS